MYNFKTTNLLHLLQNVEIWSCVCWWPSYGCAVRVDTLFSQAAQPSLGTTMCQTVKKQCSRGQYSFTNHLPWIQYIVRVRTPSMDTKYRIKLGVFFTPSEQWPWWKLIALRWLHILQQCCTISQLIYRAVVVDTTIVHVCHIANTGLVTPI